MYCSSDLWKTEIHCLHSLAPLLLTQIQTLKITLSHHRMTDEAQNSKKKSSPTVLTLCFVNCISWGWNCSQRQQFESAQTLSCYTWSSSGSVWNYSQRQQFESAQTLSCYTDAVILEWVSLLPTFQLERVAPACLYRHQCSFDKNKQMCVRHVGLALLVYWWKLRFLYGYNCLDSVWSIARPACTVLQMRVEKTSL